MVMAPNGTLITEENARKLADSGIKRISISIDGSTRESHDKFRGVEGAYEGALRGIEHAKKAGIEFQINTTITKANLGANPRYSKTGGRSGRGRPPHFSPGTHRKGKIHPGPGNHRRAIRGDPQLVLRSAGKDPASIEGHVRAPLLPNLAPARQERRQEGDFRKPWTRRGHQGGVSAERDSASYLIRALCNPAAS